MDIKDILVESKRVELDKVQSDIIENKDIYHVELDKMFNNSKLIFTGRFNDKHGITNFRLADNIILITDAYDTI
ncbi:MAG: hypothetical protein ACRDDY_18520 [Clostridium sp.]